MTSLPSANSSTAVNGAIFDRLSSGTSANRGTVLSWLTSTGSSAYWGWGKREPNRNRSRDARVTLWPSTRGPIFREDGRGGEAARARRRAAAGATGRRWNANRPARSWARRRGHRGRARTRGRRLGGGDPRPREPGGRARLGPGAGKRRRRALAHDRHRQRDDRAGLGAPARERLGPEAGGADRRRAGDPAGDRLP